MREILVDLDPDCEPLARELGISNDEISLTVNDDELNVAVVTDDFSRLIAFREFPGGRIIMVECTITEKEDRDFETPNGWIREVILRKAEAKLSLELRRQLPAGNLSKDKDGGEFNLALVAESFGFPVSGHPDEPPSTLYSGRWDGKYIKVVDDSKARHFLFFHIDKVHLECDLVWAFDLNRYFLWRNQSGK